MDLTIVGKCSSAGYHNILILWQQPIPERIFWWGAFRTIVPRSGYPLLWLYAMITVRGHRRLWCMRRNRDWKLLPEAKYRDHPAAKWPRRLGEEQGRYEEWDASGHYREWIRACKTGGTTSCSFAYGSALTEMVLLGNVAYRAGAKLEWNADSLIPKNCPLEAEGFINPPYRKGWIL